MSVPYNEGDPRSLTGQIKARSRLGGPTGVALLAMAGLAFDNFKSLVVADYGADRPAKQKDPCAPCNEAHRDHNGYLRGSGDRRRNRRTVLVHRLTPNTATGDGKGELNKDWPYFVMHTDRAFYLVRRTGAWHRVAA